MYNSNGSNYGRGSLRGSSGIPPLYVYIGIGVLVLLGIWLIAGFISAGVEGYFALAAGILLVLGNLRDLIANPSMQRSNIALLNTLIGAALISFFLGRGAFPPIGPIWYVPALLLLLGAAPLMLGRAAVYGKYLGTARTVIGSVRQLVGNLVRTN